MDETVPASYRLAPSLANDEGGEVARPLSLSATPAGAKGKAEDVAGDDSPRLEGSQLTGNGAYGKGLLLPSIAPNSYSAPPSVRTSTTRIPFPSSSGASPSPTFGGNHSHFPPTSSLRGPSAKSGGRILDDEDVEVIYSATFDSETEETLSGEL